MTLYIGNDKYVPMIGNTRGKFMIKELPYDAEIEYLRGDGRAYINTGIYDIDALEIKFRYATFYASYSPFFGNYFNENTNVWRLITSSSSSSVNLLGYVNSKASGGNTNIPMAGINTDHTLYLSQTSIIYDGNNFTGTINTTSGTTNTEPIAIFARSANGDFIPNIYMRCYYFKMWKNNVLICDMTPVRIGQVGYMYDKVSKQLFGNAGTGDFILGPDKN